MRYAQKKWTVSLDADLNRLFYNEKKSIREISQILQKSCGSIVARLAKKNNKVNMKNGTGRAFMYWTIEEDNKLDQLYNRDGLTVKEIAIIHKRSPSAISARLKIHAKNYNVDNERLQKSIFLKNN
jgi:hypothetical protein